VADRGYIIEKGRIQFQGSMREIAENEELVRKYMVV